MQLFLGLSLGHFLVTGVHAQRTAVLSNASPHASV